MVAIFRVSTLLVIYFEVVFVFIEVDSTYIGLSDVEIKICCGFCTWRLTIKRFHLLKPFLPFFPPLILDPIYLRRLSFYWVEFK